MPEKLAKTPISAAQVQKAAKNALNKLGFSRAQNLATVNNARHLEMCIDIALSVR
jgi:hypothetical protein